MGAAPWQSPLRTLGAGSGLGLAPRTRPGDPTNDSRSGDRPELARMFRSGWSRAGQWRSGVIGRAQTPGRTTPPPLVGWVPRPAFDAALGSGPAPSLAKLGRQCTTPSRTAARPL